MTVVNITQKESGPLFKEGEPQKIIGDNMRSAVAEAILFIETRVKGRTPVGVYGDSGLRGSIFSEMRSGAALEIMGVISSPLPYAEGVEIGTRPHMPNVTALIPWVEKKLGFSGEKAESVAWAIAISIKRRGTKGQKMFELGFEDSLETVEHIFDEMGFDMVVDLNRNEG